MSANPPGLELSELKRYTDLVEVMVVFIGSDRKVKMINRRVCEVMGYAEEEILGKDWFASFLPGSVRDEVIARFESLTTGQKETSTFFENPVLTKTGDERIILWHNNVLKDDYGEIIGMLASGEDITDRKLVEKTLGESEERFRNLTEATSDWVWEVDENLKYTYVSPKIRDVLGYQPHEVLGKTPLDFMLPSDTKRVSDFLEPIIAARKPFELLENVNQHKLGRVVVLETSGVPVFDAGGIFCGYRGIDRDITARKRTEQALQASEARFRNIVESSPMGMHMYRLEPDGRLVFMLANPAADKIFGVDNAQFIGKTIEDAFPALAETEVPEKYKLAASKGIPWHTEQIVYQDKKISTAYELYAFQTSPGRMVALFLDVTERKRAMESIKKRTDDISLINELNNAVNQGAGLDAIVSLLSKRTKEIFSGFGVGLYLVTEDKKSLELENLVLPRTVVGALEKLTGSKISKVRLPLTEGSFYYEAMRTKQPQLINDPETIYRFVGDYFPEAAAKRLIPGIVKVLRLGSIINLPLVSRNEVIGFINISREQPFGEDDLNRLAALSGQLTTTLEKKRVEMKEKEHLRDLTFLSQTAMEFVGFGAADDIYVYIAQKLKEIAGDVVVGVASYDESTDLFAGKAVVGFGDAVSKVVKILGQEMLGMTSRVTEEVKGRLLQRRLEEFSGDLYELTAGSIPQGVSRAVQAALGIRRIYSMGVVRQGNILGAVVIVPRKNTQLENSSTIEAFINQAAVALQRKGAEEELRKSEERYRLLVEFNPAAIAVHCEGKVVYVNNTCLRLMGGENPEEVIGRPVLDFVHPAYRKIVIERIKKSQIEGRYIEPLAEKFLRLDGRSIDVEVSAIPATYHDRPATQVVFWDITDRKRAEEGLRESEERFRSIFENSITGMYRTTPDGRILVANPALVRMLGYESFEELARRNLEQDQAKYYTLNRGRAYFKDMIERDGQVVGLESVWLKRDGEPLFVLESARAMRDEKGGILYYEGTVEDITKRKIAEEALRSSEERYRLLAENATDVIWTADMESRITYVSPSVTNLLGYSVEEALRLNLPEILNPESLQKATAALREEMELEGTPGKDPLRVRIMDLELLHKDGWTVWTETITRLLRDAEGQAFGILGVTRDITERKKVAQALKESEEMYRDLVERASDGITIIQDSCLMYVNTSLAKIAGYTVAEMHGTSFAPYIDPEELPRIQSNYTRRMAGEDLPSVYETVLRHKNGKRIYAEFNVGVVPYRGRPAELVFIRDITERRRIEEQLIRSSKLASLGVLASGIAHQVNNPLAIILFASTAIKDLLESQSLSGEAREKTTRFLATLEEQVYRTRRVVSGLLSFAQTKRSEIASTDINLVIRKAVDFICEHLPLAEVELKLDLRDELPRASVDPVALEEVLVNLVQNSYEAMQGRGRLIMRTEKGTKDTIRIAVSDIGPGVPQELRDEIFEPLFTTKDTEKGTGLGLSVSVLLLERFGGRIWVEDTPGGGATFVVEVPQAKEENERG